MEAEKRGRPSSEHEHVYHAASCCQAASLSLTARHLHGLKKACSVEGKKTGGFASQGHVFLRCFESVKLLCCFKRRAIIGLVRLEHSENDPSPNVRQSTNSDAMTFPFCPFALVIGFGPGFLLGALPGELVQRIPQWFDAALAAVWLRIGATLKQDRRGSSKSLQAGSSLVPCGIIADFCEQPRGQALSCRWQTAEDFLVFMAQKKVFNLFIVSCNLLKQGQELSDQSQHQARLGTGGDSTGRQVRLMKRFNNLGSRSPCSGMSSLLERLGDLLGRGPHRELDSGIRVQEEQRRLLLERASKQLQCDGRQAVS